ncbi:ABC transporter permease [Actinacidiphila acididurans]|uniref:ABC transporter permease n=1 Tax=Actinacidiphila acididurans TaxID=2784346 RepID=A0ABS2U1W9_9ACTN|nr:ABC transporter permease [Actinacidiphila acididurans]MBM9509597.1 ABC transporter permease [Actinacidiphila acididurans]
MSTEEIPAPAQQSTQEAEPAAAPPPVPRTGPAPGSARPDAPQPVTTVPGGVETVRPDHERRRRGIPRPVRRSFGPLGALLLWWLLSRTGALSADTLASPVAVFRRGWDLAADGTLGSAIWVSARRVGEGFLIGALAGTALALLAGLFRLGEDLIDATVGMLRALPWVGLIPLFIVWFGIDETPKIALVVIAVTFPLYFNIYAGIRGVDDQLVEAGRVLGLGRWGLIRHIVLPGALPSALVGLRYALGSAWLALVFAEQINAGNGIGYLMNNAEQFFQTDVIVVCLVVYAVLGLVSDLIVRLATTYLLSWRASFDGA